MARYAFLVKLLTGRRNEAAGETNGVLKMTCLVLRVFILYSRSDGDRSVDESVPS